jgi:AcrR family transcriptional regulator
LDHPEPQEKSYHHGDLRRAILDAAERRLTESGIEAVTIRASARDAGVSPAAPIHHFGGLKGVLSGLAARGFERLVAHLAAEAASKPAQSPASLLVGAYVGFALSAPNLFDLMWREDLLDPEDVALKDARGHALTNLRTLSAQPAHGRAARIQAIRLWSLAHGLAMLLRHGRIVTALGSEEDGLRSVEDFVALAREAGFA